MAGFGCQLAKSVQTCRPTNPPLNEAGCIFLPPSLGESARFSTLNTESFKAMFDNVNKLAYNLFN